MTPQRDQQKPNPVRRTPEQVTKAPKKARQILQEALQTRFGLTMSQASAHAALLAIGQLTPYEVSIYSGLALGETESALEALADKRLVKAMPGVVKRYFAFAPYKELATLVGEFRRQAFTTLESLQTRQKHLRKELPDQLVNVAVQLGKGLAKSYHSQSQTLRAAATTARTSLVTLTHAQQKALTNLSNSSMMDVSSQTTALQKTLNQSLDDTSKQLQDAYAVALKEPLKLIAAHRQTSQQWLDASRDQLLDHLQAAKAQLKGHLDNTSTVLGQLIETTLNAARADAAPKVEGAQRRLQEAAASVTSRIQAFGKKQRQSIEAWQKQQSQTTKQAVQVLAQNERESLNQVGRTLTQIRSDIDKTLNRESQRVAQDFERSTAEIVSVVNDWSEGATQIGDNLFLNLRTSVSERIQAFLQLHKETQSTVSQWPPTALTFTQLTTLKDDLIKVIEAAAKESGNLVKSAVNTIGANLDGISLAQLGEQEKLLQSLADSLEAQQSTSTKNVEAALGKAARSIELQSTALLKAADGTVKSLQDQLRNQVKLGQDLREKSREAISQEVAAVVGVLGAVGGRLQQYADTQIPATDETIRALSATCVARVRDHGKAVGKHLTGLEAALARSVDETDRSFQQRLERIQGLVSQFGKDAQTTSGGLQPVQDVLERSSTAVQDLLPRVDSETAQRIKVALEDLAHAAQQYASTNQSNVVALTTAITKALDEESKSLAASISSFQSRAKEFLVKSKDELGQEEKTLVEGIATDLSGMSQGCLSQLSQVRTLIQSFGQELVSDVGTLTQKAESMTADTDTALNSGLSAFQAAGDAFIQDSLSETKQLVEKNSELNAKVQSLIRQQAATTAESLGAASNQLRQFASTRIPAAKEATREANGSYATTLKEWQTTFEKQMDELKTQMAAKCDSYVSNLQKELGQLQSVAATMTKRFAQAGQSLDSLLREQIEKSLTTYLTTIEEQGTQLQEEVSNAFQATSESFAKIQDSLLSVLGQDLQNGKTAAEEAISRTNSTLEEAIRGISTQSEAFGETLRTALGTAIEENAPSAEEAFAAARAAIDAALDAARETIGRTLAGFNDQISSSFAALSQSLDEEGQQLRDTITTDAVTASSELAEGSTHAKDKLDQMGHDGVRRASDVLQSNHDAALESVEEHSRAVAEAITQFVASANRSVSAQARQTAKQVFAELGAARQVMKTEGQVLVKESGNLLKQTSTATLTVLDAFGQSAEPALNRIEAAAADLQQILATLWDSIAELEVSQIERTWRIVTKQGVQNHLQDMIRRAQTTITLVYPSLEEAPLEQLTAMPPNCRVHLITSLARGGNDEILRKLLTRGNMRIWHSAKTEFYAGSRDGEEVLIAPIYGEPEEVVAVASDHSSYVALFNQSLGPHWISGATELVQQKPPQA